MPPATDEQVRKTPNNLVRRRLRESPAEKRGCSSLRRARLPELHDGRVRQRLAACVALDHGQVAVPGAAQRVHLAALLVEDVPRHLRARARAASAGRPGAPTA